ncbi:hypothetical protein GCM10009720_23660 [Yaniella flava]|uniref:Acetone carboxylase n=2 Tax=Yaniella flava TaxID=287930 RepID=A0ABN2URR8_9MICC
MTHGPDLLGNLMLTGSATVEPQATELQCSRKSCTEGAVWQLLWNNPKIHDTERRKIWLACDEHREFLADFLSSRAFLKEIQPLSR